MGIKKQNIEEKLAFYFFPFMCYLKKESNKERKKERKINESKGGKVRKKIHLSFTTIL